MSSPFNRLPNELVWDILSRNFAKAAPKSIYEERQLVRSMVRAGLPFVCSRFQGVLDAHDSRPFDHLSDDLVSKILSRAISKPILGTTSDSIEWGHFVMGKLPSVCSRFWGLLYSHATFTWHFWKSRVQKSSLIMGALPKALTFREKLQFEKLSACLRPGRIERAPIFHNLDKFSTLLWSSKSTLKTLIVLGAPLAKLDAASVVTYQETLSNLVQRAACLEGLKLDMGIHMLDPCFVFSGRFRTLRTLDLFCDRMLARDWTERFPALKKLRLKGCFSGDHFLRSDSLLEFTWDSVMPDDTDEPIILSICTPNLKHLKINVYLMCLFMVECPSLKTLFISNSSLVENTINLDVDFGNLLPTLNELQLSKICWDDVGMGIIGQLEGRVHTFVAKGVVDAADLERVFTECKSFWYVTVVQA
jgi:hypothetical protein